MEKFTIFKTDKIFSFVIAKYVLALLMLFITQLVFYIFNSTLFEPVTFGGCMKIIWGNIVFGISTVAMAPNVAGVIGSAVAAGILLGFLG